MKIQGLVNVLNGMTNIPFTEWSWSEPPKNRYGVVTIDGQSELKADEDPAAEKMRTGYVDVFIKTSDPDPTDDVENAMKMLGVWFRMESIQFEPESGFLHFEWKYTDTQNKITKKLYLITFTANGSIIDREAIEVNEMPSPPEVRDERIDGINLYFNGWDPEIRPATKNTVYEARYSISVSIIDRFAYNELHQPFTTEQINKIIELFNEDTYVIVYDPEAGYIYANDVDEQGIEYEEYFAQWA